MSFLTGRKGGLLDNDIICTIHGILFQIGQRFSVFLVSVLSISRTLTLMFPLRRLNKRVLIIMVVSFLTALIAYFVLPLIIGVQVWAYHPEGVYCWADPVNGYELWNMVDNILDCAALSLPVLPITISCCISTVHVHKSQAITQNSITSNNLKQKATVTIILLTALYIVFNIPLFLNFVVYTITITKYELPGPFYESDFMFFYSWNISMILSTSLNSTLNPFIYMTRIANFRTWLRRCLGIVSGKGHVVTDYEVTRDTAIILHKVGCTDNNKSVVTVSDDVMKKKNKSVCL